MQKGKCGYTVCFLLTETVHSAFNYNNFKNCFDKRH